MRFSVVALSVSALSALAIGPAFADSADNVNQTIKAFAALKSVHTAVTAPQGSGTLDEVAPNKSRVFYNVMGRQVQLVRIGSDSWLNVGGQWRKSHFAGGAGITEIFSARRAVLERKDIRQGYNVSDAGTAMVGGVAGHKYHLVDKEDSSRFGDVIVGPDSLPLQLIIHTDEGPMTYTFSRFNGVADISPPV